LIRQLSVSPDPLTVPPVLRLLVNCRRQVCVVDTGLDRRHPEFATTGWKGVGSPAVGSWAQDGRSHGTHVTGTVAARRNGIGVVGVAPLANVVTVKVFNSLGNYAYASSVANAALDCYKRGAKVVNLSLSGEGASQDENDIYDWLLANGVVTVGCA
jgi:serine protease